MNTYTLFFISAPSNQKEPGEILEILEMQRPFFGRREMATLVRHIDNIFQMTFAYDFTGIRVEVKKNGKHIFWFDSNTTYHDYPDMHIDQHFYIMRPCDRDPVLYREYNIVS